jgi:tetratricopeptide (TPR) repeat protein
MRLITILFVALWSVENTPTWAALESGDVNLSTPSASDEGRRLIQKKSWAEAALVLRKSFESQRGQADVAIELARALVYLGRRQEAISVLSQCASKNPERRIELERRAQVISRTFAKQSTFDSFQEGVRLLRERKWELAKDRFERVQSEETDVIDVLMRLGQSQLFLSETDSAAETLRRAHGLNPKNPLIQAWLARAQFLKGDTASSLELFEKINRNETQTLWYAEALAAAGRVPQALTLLDEEWKKNPKWTRARLLWGELSLGALGRDRGAVQILSRDLQALKLMVATETTPKSELLWVKDLDLELPEAVSFEDRVRQLFQRIESRLSPRGDFLPSEADRTKSP